MFTHDNKQAKIPIEFRPIKTFLLLILVNLLASADPIAIAAGNK